MKKNYITFLVSVLFILYFFSYSFGEDLVKKLLEFGYNVDGLVPSAWMSKYAKDIIGDLKNEERGQ